MAEKNKKRQKKTAAGQQRLETIASFFRFSFLSAIVRVAERKR